jgi:Spy/CpxP family protein refolding chaperone
MTGNRHYASAPLRWISAGVLGAALVLPAVSTWAQEAAPTSRPAARVGSPAAAGALIDRFHEVVTGLNLSDDQKTQVNAIFDKAKQDMASLQQEFQTNNTPPAERIQRVNEFRRDLRQKLEKVLNQQQRQELRQKLTEGRPGTRPAGGAAMFGRIQEAVGQLNLSDEQKVKINGILDEARTKAQAIRQEAAAQTRPEREPFRQLMQETRQKIHEVLTPEQRQKLRSLMPGRGEGRGARRGAAPAANQ